MKKFILTENAPKPIGPYSQAVEANNSILFISGQIPFKPDGTLIGNDIESQTRQVLININSILLASGYSIENVVKTTVYMIDLGHFDVMNKIYSEYFESSKPARAAIQVSRLPKDVLVEIDAIAVK